MPEFYLFFRDPELWCPVWWKAKKGKKKDQWRGQPAPFSNILRENPDQIDSWTCVKTATSLEILHESSPANIPMDQPRQLTIPEIRQNIMQGESLIICPSSPWSSLHNTWDEWQSTTVTQQKSTFSSRAFLTGNLLLGHRFLYLLPQTELWPLVQSALDLWLNFVLQFVTKSI